MERQKPEGKRKKEKEEKREAFSHQIKKPLLVTSALNILNPQVMDICFHADSLTQFKSLNSFVFNLLMHPMIAINLLKKTQNKPKFQTHMKKLTINF